MSAPETRVRALDAAPRSIDPARRTAEIVISTGAGVTRFDHLGPFREVLDVAGVDTRRESIPLLDSHRQDTLDRVLGRVVEVRREGGALVATVRFAKTSAGEAAFQAVRDGDYSSASIGYSALDVSEGVDRATGDRVHTVTRFELQEVSLVPVPADAGAQVRSMGSMSDETETQTRAAPTQEAAPVTTTPPPMTTPEPVTLTRAQSNREIRALSDTFGLGREFADGHIDAGSDVETVRAAAQQAVTTRTAAPRVTVSTVHEPSPERTVELMGEALFARSVPGHEPSEQARSFINLTTLDMARQCLVRAGVSTTAMSSADTVTRALHTTSDFPAIFGDTANRALRAGYEAAPSTLKMVARQTTARDFRERTGVLLGAGSTLERVGEAGEYKHGTFNEASESYALDTFGKIFGISRKAIVNDDIGAFADIAGKLGMAAVEFEGQFLVDVLVSNGGDGPVMKDGKTLFHEDHDNRFAAYGITVDSLSNGRQSMRRQKGLAGRPINVAPRYLIVPPELETDAERLLMDLQATRLDDVNPFGGKLDLLVEARLTDPLRWYVTANPAQIDGLEYAYLQGEEGPQIETRAGFEVDGLEVKVRLDFGAAFMDHRAWYVSDDEQDGGQ